MIRHTARVKYNKITKERVSKKRMINNYIQEFQVVANLSLSLHF